MNESLRPGNPEQDLAEVVNFLKSWAQDKNADLAFFSEQATFYSGPQLITLPSASGSVDMGAYERADLMQQAEEAWNYQDPEPKSQILLVPTEPRSTISELKGK